mmetsp:Transcript_83275/g.235734  ORF Transcript_83275/g.235734 Transcript_83275/m.235734 type:complete len:86 (+) Transcript_83275:37-294(+)
MDSLPNQIPRHYFQHAVTLLVNCEETLPTVITLLQESNANGFHKVVLPIVLNNVTLYSTGAMWRCGDFLTRDCIEFRLVLCRITP